MAKAKFLVIMVIFILTFPCVFSLEMMLQGQPDKNYNLDDMVEIPVKITSQNGVQGNLNMVLDCDDSSEEFYTNGMRLKPVSEKTVNPTLIFTEDIVNPPDECEIKASLKDTSVSTNEFGVFDKIDINLTSDNKKYEPGEDISLEGRALKLNGNVVDGIINVSLSIEDFDYSYLNTINNETFNLNFQLPEDAPAGDFPLNIYIYEKNFNDEITNEGDVTKNFRVKSIPKSLEILLDRSKVKPGNNLSFGTFLYDQNGREMSSQASITIKNSTHILEETNISTGEVFKYPVEEDNKPEEWFVFAESQNFTDNESVKILEDKDIKTSFFDNTIEVKNKGNVGINESLSVNIGNQTEEVNLTLGVGESVNYSLTAPDGEYNVSVDSDEDKESESGMMSLTGEAVGVNEEGEKDFSVIKSPLVWILLIMISLVVIFMIYKNKSSSEKDN